MVTSAVKNDKMLPVRLMFQDEARFGRISDPSACWAPTPYRPLIDLALVREFKYEYAAISPMDGALDYMTSDKMNTENMNRFLSQVSDAHKDEFNIMILDGASSHKSKDLVIPENISLVLLPPYSPELNPVEQVWRILRRNEFANKIFDSLEKAIGQAEKGLRKMASNGLAMSRLSNWPWIYNAILIAN